MKGEKNIKKISLSHTLKHLNEEAKTNKKANNCGKIKYDLKPKQKILSKTLKHIN